MKLWILRPIKGLQNSPWEPWYDKAFGFVIRANTAREARGRAESQCGDESSDWTGLGNVWTMPKYTTCTQLKVAGSRGVILRDFRAA